MTDTPAAGWKVTFDLERTKVPTSFGASSGKTTAAFPSEPALFGPSWSHPSPTRVSHPSSDWSCFSRPSCQARVAAVMSSGAGAAKSENARTVESSIGALL